MNSLFRGLEQQFLLRAEGALDDDSWHAVDRMIKDWAELPGVQGYFMDRGRWYTDGFVEHVWSTIGGRPDGAGRSLAEQYADTNP
jgi:hypothetical protein